MTAAPLLPVSLTCNTDLRFIDLIQVVGSELLKHMNFSHEDGERVWLAIQEGIGNAMRHGNKLDKRKNIEVTFTPQANRLEIRIRDTGKGVDLAALPNPNLPENLLKPCGRGVFFMKQVMDQVVMETDAGGSTLLLVKLRRTADHAAEAN
ncbi:ATP-binding protein [Geothrix sp. 21YS21S-2]|uniref:ATP-binding protein n=1 Tax=Geothrix sp. 21YS21S-2 TaxID=3068893 RepID=UPI0027B955EB|nr:ATP-binding protein [Geothrix sp. 21YS21S-2]